jgi:TRAP-type C4-dicarboxylate transport system permease small subunit
MESADRPDEADADVGIMTDDATPRSPVAAPSKGRDRLELIATIVLAIAALGTAWSGYQASRWNGQQAEAASSANAARIAAARAAGEADADSQIDIATFVQWVDARASGRAALARFYEQRFRPEFKPAFEAWIATRPLRNPSAPATPFAMPEYQPAARAQADELGAQADGHSEDMKRDVQRATNYVLAVVLFSVSLFFAGISTKLTTPRLRAVMVTLGCAVLVGTLTWVATSPVNFSI